MSDELQKKIFAKNLLRQLALSGKSQKEVADSLGISQSYISRLEKKIVSKLKKEMRKYK